MSSSCSCSCSAHSAFTIHLELRRSTSTRRSSSITLHIPHACQWWAAQMMHCSINSFQLKFPFSFTGRLEITLGGFDLRFSSNTPEHESRYAFNTFPENHEVFVVQTILSESFEVDLTKDRTILRMGCSLYTPDHDNGRDDDLHSLSAPFVITKSGLPTEDEVGLNLFITCQISNLFQHQW